MLESVCFVGIPCKSLLMPYLVYIGNSTFPEVDES